MPPGSQGRSNWVVPVQRGRWRCRCHPGWSGSGTEGGGGSDGLWEGEGMDMYYEGGVFRRLKLYVQEPITRVMGSWYVIGLLEPVGQLLEF